MTGLRRQLRASVAAVLAGTASVLSTAAALAETVAQELRLSMPSPETDATDMRPADGTSLPTDRATSGSVLSDVRRGGRDVDDIADPGVTDRPGGGPDAVDAEPVMPAPGSPGPFEPSGAPERDTPITPGMSAAPDIAEASPSEDLGAATEAERTAEEVGQVLDETPRAAGDGKADAPAPWVDDVAASVAGGTVKEATARLPELTAPQLRALERYERSHLSRVTLLRAVEAELSVRPGG